MRLKLVVKPSPDGICRREHIRVENADTGEHLSGVQNIKMELDVHNHPILVLTVLDYEADVEGKVDAVVWAEELSPRPSKAKKSWWRRVLDWWAY